MSTNEDVLLISDGYRESIGELRFFVVRRIIVWLTDRFAGASGKSPRVDCYCRSALQLPPSQDFCFGLRWKGRREAHGFSWRASHVNIGPSLRFGSVLSSKSKR
ncbi:hypothetical protein CQ10_09610 [Bradyrhizobium valentinum]|uniref:Uncharacterized protein n=1 Tax=Bradyrhizobium valentinum TaxID=1518501 RepID=A0A0R3LD71_9BRAD|nr:hypothetical protein CP49_04025 [Bradyrhizobium valentinum]KRR14057.1 hypothetical protein CQ10_09610 [Bradyrhizobium valentinum]